MARKGYSADADPDRSAKASGRDLPVHFKDAVHVCKAVRGLDVPAARDYLEAVAAKERPVEAFRHGAGAGHRKGGKGPGNYPVKVARALLTILHNAENNAEYKGLDPEAMVVRHCAAQKAATLEGFTPRAQGNSSAWNTTMTHLEVIIAEEDLEEAS